MNKEHNKILDQLMEKISKAVADEEYDKVVIYNEELCAAVMDMTNSCAEEDKESLYNLISDARDEIDGLKDQIIARQNKLSSDTNKAKFPFKYLAKPPSKSILPSPKTIRILGLKSKDCIILQDSPTT